MTVLAQGSRLSSRQDAVYILVGLSMEANTNNTPKGQRFIGTKLLPDNQSSAVRIRLQARKPFGRRAKEISCSMERKNPITITEIHCCATNPTMHAGFHELGNGMWLRRCHADAHSILPRGDRRDR